MAPRMPPTLVPQCSACVRTSIYADYGYAAWRPLLQQQTRGAKASKRPTSIAVQLLKDQEAYGRQGTFVPIPAGVMRNRWFPSLIARYPTLEEQRAIKRGQIEVQRDYDFAPNSGTGTSRKLASPNAAQKAWESYMGIESSSRPTVKPAEDILAKEIQTKTVEPSRAIALLDVLLPDVIPFERNPIPRPASESKLPASLQAAMKAKMPDAPLAIYGSVTTADVANAMRDAVRYNDEAAQIQLGETSLKFFPTQVGDDASRIKHLGTYEVEVSFKGVEQTVRRTVAIKEPEDNFDAITFDTTARVTVTNGVSPSG